MAVVKAGLLAPIVEDKKPKSAKALSTTTGVEELLIGRLSRLSVCIKTKTMLTVDSSFNAAVNSARYLQGDRSADLYFHAHL